MAKEAYGKRIETTAVTQIEKRTDGNAVSNARRTYR